MTTSTIAKTGTGELQNENHQHDQSNERHGSSHMSSHMSSHGGQHNGMTNRVEVRPELLLKNFEIGQHVVHPPHGPAQINGIVKMQVPMPQASQQSTDATHTATTHRASVKTVMTPVSFYQIYVTKDKANVYVPVASARQLGMRELSTQADVARVTTTLKESSKGLRVVWNRRSREYEQKIQSGDVVACAEVVRDLYKNVNNPNRSYTEAILYDNSFYRVAMELSLVTGKEFDAQKAELEELLSKWHETYRSLLDSDNEVESELSLSGIEEDIDAEDFSDAPDEVANA